MKLASSNQYPQNYGNF